MSNTIVLNSSNIVGIDNNTMVYDFPSSVNFKNHKVAVESISINYSWYNISAALIIIHFLMFGGKTRGRHLP